MPCDEQARHVDVLCFTKSDTGRAEVPVDRHGEESSTASADQEAARHDRPGGSACFCYLCDGSADLCLVELFSGEMVCDNRTEKVMETKKVKFLIFIDTFFFNY